MNFKTNKLTRINADAADSHGFLRKMKTPFVLLLPKDQPRSATSAFIRVRCYFFFAIDEGGTKKLSASPWL